MPRAVVSLETRNFPLKELEGGFIELRRLSYGEVLKRRDLLQSMREADLSPERDGRRERRDVEMTLNFSRIREYEFSKAVIDHNLEDEGGNRLDIARDFQRLDPKVGQEIESYMDEMNGFGAWGTGEAEEEPGEPSFRGSSDPGGDSRQEGPSEGS